MSAKPTVQVKSWPGLMSLVKDAMPKSKLVTFPTTQPPAGHFTASHPTSCARTCPMWRSVSTKAVILEMNRMTALLRVSHRMISWRNCVLYVMYSTQAGWDCYVLTYSSVYGAIFLRPQHRERLASFCYWIGKRPCPMAWSKSRKTVFDRWSV